MDIIGFRATQNYKRKIKVARLKRIPKIVKSVGISFSLVLLMFVVFGVQFSIRGCVALFIAFVLFGVLYHFISEPDIDGLMSEEERQIIKLKSEVEKYKNTFEALEKIIIEAADGPLPGVDKNMDGVSFWYDKKDKIFEFNTPNDFVSSRTFKDLIDRIISEIYLSKKPNNFEENEECEI